MSVSRLLLDEVTNLSFLDRLGEPDLFIMAYNIEQIVFLLTNIVWCLAKYKARASRSVLLRVAWPLGA